MQLLGKRWTGLVLSSLLSGPKRFSEIEALTHGAVGREDLFAHMVALALVPFVYPNLYPPEMMSDDPHA